MSLQQTPQTTVTYSSNPCNSIVDKLIITATYSATQSVYHCNVLLISVQHGVSISRSVFRAATRQPATGLITLVFPYLKADQLVTKFSQLRCLAQF